MNSKSITIVVPTPPQRLFNYLADIDNLPEWATEYCRELKRVNGRARVVSPMGEVNFRIAADPETGVIDFYSAPDGGPEGCLPTRVLPAPEGATAYTAIWFQLPDMPDAVFQEQCASLQREMNGIKKLFS